MALYDDNVDSFDPMLADFNDVKFNSYTEGRGKYLGNPEEVPEITLQVSNIPSEMSRQALLNIFSRYGEVEVVNKFRSRIHMGQDVAHLKYKNQISANRAILSVHKEPPFFLLVKFAPPKSRNVKDDDMYNDSRILELVKQEVPETDQPKPDNIYEGPRLEEIQSSFFPSESIHNCIISDNFDPLYCNLFVSFHKNKYKIYPILDENSSKYVSTGKNKVSLGRCFYVEEKKEEESQNRAESQNKQKSLMTGKKLGNFKFSRCVLCPQKIAKFICSKRCQTFYCSPECRTQDLPEHKSICSSSAQNNCPSDSSTIRSLKVTHVDDEFIYAIKSEDLERFETLKKRLQTECQNQQSIRLVSGRNCAVLDKERDQWCRGLIVEVSSPLSTIYFIDYGFSKQCMATSIQWLDSDLAKDEPFALKIKPHSGINPSFTPGSRLNVKALEWANDAGYYTAFLIENEDNKSSISSMANSKMSKFFRETEVKIIDLSCGRCSEDFTEVTIMGLLSSSTYYVSWNNLTSIDENDKMNAYIKIMWEDRKTKLPTGAKIKVRSFCRISSDFFYVEPSIIEERSELNSDDRLPVIEWFEENNKGKIQVTNFKRDNLFLACLVLDDECKVLDGLKSIFKIILGKLNKKLSKLPVMNGFVPKVGDCVAVYVEFMNYWTRGIVWSVSFSFVRCSLIDLGFVVSVHQKQVRALEKKYESYPFFGVSCEIKRIETGKELEFFQKSLETKYDFVVVEKRSDSVLCSLLNGDEEICMVEMKEWEPTAEEIGLKAVELKNKTEVKITQFYSSSILHITPVSQANFLINQKLMKHVQSSQPLKDPPRFGQLVACKWSKDNRYYRAQVLEPIKKSLYRIFFVDYGTQEFGSLEDIYELDDELLSYPCLSVKISLKGVGDAEILDYKAMNYLNSLGFKEEPLKIVFENNDLSNVELYDLHGVLVNGKVKDYLKPEDLKEDEQFYDNEINFDDLEIGKEVVLGLLRKHYGIYFMFKPNTDLAQFVFGTFQNLINDYCEGLNSKGYTPRKGEVIFVQISTRDMPEKCWCRAVVNESKFYGSFVVNCLDYGGRGDILVSSMRKMHPKFMVVPAVALIVVPNMPQDLAPSQKEKIDSFFSPLKTYSGRAIAGKDIEYCVEMDFLNNILKQL